MTTYLVRTELRRRLGSFVALTLVVTAVVAVVLASWAGARRAETAFDRYLERYDSPAAAAFSFKGDPADLAPLHDLDAVEEAIPFELVGAFPEADADGFYPFVVAEGGALPYEHMRAPVVDGRAPDRDEPFEVALSERTARRLGVGVGDDLPLVTFSPEALEAWDTGEEVEPDGPAVALDVVGVVRDPGDVGARESDMTLTFFNPAFREAIPPDEVGSVARGSMVILAEGHEIAEVTTALAGAPVELDTSFSTESSDQQISPTLKAIATSTRLFALVAALAGVVALSQAITRLQLEASADDPTLEALGAARGARWRRLFLPATAACTIGAALGTVGAIALSTMFPVGLARKAEPDLGVDVDVEVLAGGFALSVACLALTTGILATWRVRRHRADAGAPALSRWARALADLGAPAPAVTGLSLASGTPGRPGRLAVGGTLLSVLGVLAALVFSASVDRLAADPSLYGWGWDAVVEGDELTSLDEERAPALLRTVSADPDVRAAALMVSQVPVTIDDAPLYATALDRADHALRPIVVKGTLPAAADEVAVGGDDLEVIGARLGDEVELTLAGVERTARLTGVVAFPVPEDGGSSATGVYLSPETGVPLLAKGCEESDSCTTTIAVALEEGADPAGFAARLQDTRGGIEVALPEPPGEVSRLIAVEDLPRYLALFLAALAAIAVSFATATTVRQRRRDFAVLRVIGMTGRHVRVVVIVLVFSLTAAGAALGGVLGLIIGRQVWRAVADSVSLPFSPSLPVLAAILVPLAAVVLAQVVASTSRRAAGRVPAAIVLRAE